MTTGTWTDVNALDFTGPIATASAGALDGNASANRLSLSRTFSVSIPAGQEIMLRWQDTNDSGNDHGLAIDDLSVTPKPGAIYLSINDAAVTEGNSGTTTATFTVSLTSPAGVGGVTFDIATQDNIATTANNDYVARSLTGQTIAQGSSTYNFAVTVNGDTNVEANETFFANVTNVVGAAVSAGQGTGTINNDDTVRIRDIQGSAHLSPYNNQAVSGIPGIVTAVSATGFWMQDSTSDANDATSEAIFVYTASAPGRAIGDSVTVNGTVSEYRPAGNANNLTTTEITSPSVTLVSTGNALPAAIIIGTGGRVPPTTIICDDAVSNNVENAGTTFDPANDGIDFWESLEGMRVQINNARAIGPSRYCASSNSWEIPVVDDNGANSTVNTIRGGVTRSSDFNPERILIADALNPIPGDVNVGDGLGTVIGVIDYSFSNFKLYVTATPTRVNNNLAQETTTAQTGNQFAVATLSVENLNPSDCAAKFDGLANIIVTNMQSPDLIVVEEIQDNNGATNDGTVDASTTLNTLISAITTAGGPAYQYRQIDPTNNADGGETGGNIRQGFLFRTDRGMAFVDRGSATATTANSVTNNAGVPQLACSPGRIDPNNTSFNTSRKPLAGEFTFGGARVYVIGNHFNSKGGDQPLYGPTQPPVLSSETQRVQQATIVRDFVSSILAIDPNANVLVMGDLNDFEFSTPITTLKNGAMLSVLITGLAQNECYSYTYEGNLQTLDHIMTSANLMKKRARTDVVHVNAEFATRWSDHDPSVAVFDLSAPTAVTLSNFTARAADARGVILMIALIVGSSIAIWIGARKRDN